MHGKYQMWPQANGRKGCSWSHHGPLKHFSPQEEDAVRALDEWLHVYGGAGKRTYKVQGEGYGRHEDVPLRSPFKTGQLPANSVVG